MNVDVACVGDPFLDLIFKGLPSLPVPGEEQLATSLAIVPGGMANVAYALGRFGLRAVVCAPIGRDPASNVHEAAGGLAALGTTIVVTRGPAGVLALTPNGPAVEVPAPTAGVADSTGAGDLFVGSYIWADLAGKPLEDRLVLATTYASRSLERATDRQKGIALADFSHPLIG